MENKRHYEYTNIEEHDHGIPLWLLLLYLVFPLLFAVYLVLYLY